ncbi:MAG: 23S rRNA (adenine(2030)-N(6))-methyltransferase RlmJ [Mariprofundus sp.]|nr:23S rRNA (adenine(2030)-N(6))-methyltransferase RlmJ [Mariprofundus sp.]
MLSYQHTYHAGNHADVLKYIILADIVSAMQKKITPMFLFDVFASRGIYDLTSPEALKNREFDTGIGKIWPSRHHNPPAGVKPWMQLIQHENNANTFKRLPGSTALLASMLRDIDRLAACDLHPQEFEGLRHSFASHSRHHRKISLHKRDAFEALGALLPPKEKRALIFIDPSYEQKDEYKKIVQAISTTYPRFSTGVYVVWYPLLPAQRHVELFNAFKRSGIRNILRVELDCRDSFPAMQMHGSGLLMINPPWHAQQAMQRSLHWINQTLTDGNGASHIDWLVGE